MKVNLPSVENRAVPIGTALYAALAAVAVLGVVLILAVLVLILILILVAVLILVLVLVIHSSSSKCLFAVIRYGSLPSFSGFIPGFENQAYQKACENRNGNAAGTGFQSPGKDAEKTILLHCLLNALGQNIAEAS